MYDKWWTDVLPLLENENAAQPAFNLFNNVCFGGINLNIANAAFGRVTAQVNTPRAVQFKAKILF